MLGCLHDRRPAASEPGGATPHETALRLINWLLSDEVQLPIGAQAGGVLGWFDGASTRFVYPESTGYYLTILSFLHARGWPVDGIPRRARRAADWLDRQGGRLSPPATRVYLSDPPTKDWRNSFSFSFDLAMIWRGIAMTRQFLGAASADRVQAAVERRLFPLCSPDGGLLASVPIQPGPAAESWSVHPGPFQLKSAAALLCSGGNPPPELRRNAQATFERFREWTPNDCQPEFLHPCLYYVEGALLAGAAQNDPSLLRRAALALERLAAGALGPCGEPLLTLRSDAMAQILRSGCLLEAGGYLQRDLWNVALPRIATALCRYCGPDGRMHFQRDAAGRPRHVNVWSGLFAAQALLWYGDWSRRALAIESAAWLV
jgi:hypothetical protein